MPRLPRPRPIRYGMGASLGSRAVHVMAPRQSPTCSRSLVRSGPRSVTPPSAWSRCGRAVPAAGPLGRGPAAAAAAREQDHGYGITEYVPCDAAFGHPVTCLLYTSDAADEEDSVD